MNGRTSIGVTALLFISSVAGCPQPADTSNAAATQTSVASTSINTPAVKREPTRYWVQRDGVMLQLYRLPDDRQAAGTWFDLDGGVSWFSGDGLYEFSGELGWERVEDSGLTLDEVLQTLDVRPAAN